MAGNLKLIRKQHVVSKFYLKGFADSTNQLRRTLLPGHRSHLISVEKASVISDFYNITLEDGQLSDYFERAFSRVEGPAAAVHKSIVEEGRWPLEVGEKCDLALWIALQHLRSEGIRTQGTNLKALTIQLLVGASGKQALRRHIERAEGRAVSDERLEFEWTELTREGGPRIKPEPRDHLRMVAELLEPTAAILGSMQWSLNVYSRRRLVTGDHPVSLLKNPEHPAFFGVGLANAGGFMLPLSRRLGLVIGASPELPDLKVDGNTLLANGMNQGTVMNSRTCLYSHPDDEDVISAMHVPSPRQYEIDPIATAGFIAEEGLFNQLSNEAIDQASIPTTTHDDSEGFGLDDLEWPIPNRIHTWTGVA